jgi:cysteine-rich repeat protein
MRNSSKEISSDRADLGLSWPGGRGAAVFFAVQFTGRCLCALAIALLASMWVPSVGSASLSAHLSSTPISAAPDGYMAYALSVSNDSIDTVDANLKLTIDPDLAYLGSNLSFIQFSDDSSSSSLASCDLCTQDTDCPATPVVHGFAGQQACDDCPPTPTSGVGECRPSGICTAASSQTCIAIIDSPSDPPVVEVFFGNLASGALKRGIFELQVAPDTPLSETDQNPITNQLETLLTVKAFPEGGGDPVADYETKTKTTVADGSSTPIIASLSVSPSGHDRNERARPGQSLLYKVMLTNRGAFARDLTASLTLDPQLEVEGFRATAVCTRDGDCYEQCPSNTEPPPRGCFDKGNVGHSLGADQSKTTSFPFLAVEPGQFVELRVKAKIKEGTTNTRVSSKLLVKDEKTDLTVASPEPVVICCPEKIRNETLYTPIDVCSDRIGQPCSNGDACEGDVCGMRAINGEEVADCFAQACVDACTNDDGTSKDDGTSCDGTLDEDACTVEVCQSGDCVFQTDETGTLVPLQCDFACEACDPDAGCQPATFPTACYFPPENSPCESKLNCSGSSPQCPHPSEGYLEDGADCGNGRVCRRQSSGAPLCLLPGSCGDGNLDSDEQCDDGNQQDGDCCSATCTNEGAGNSCSTGNVCDGEAQCDGSGTCQPKTTPVFKANSICETTSCSKILGVQHQANPAIGCLPFDHAKLVINELRPGHESLTLDMRDGPHVDLTAFGDPTNGSEEYTVCVYRVDDNGALAGQLDLNVSGDTKCGKKNCWQKRKSLIYHYRDKDFSHSGIGSMKLHAGPEGRSRMVLHGRNNARKHQTSLPTGGLGIAQGLDGSFEGARVQIRRNDDASCFEANISSVARSGPSFFKAKSQ